MSESVQYQELPLDLYGYKNEVGGNCKHVAFDGIKGGSGKTTLNLNGAVMLSHYFRKKVCVVDLDVQMATSAMVLDRRNKRLKELKEQGVDMSDYGNPIAVIKPFKFTIERIQDLVERVKDFDYCFYDLGGFASEKSYVIGAYADLHLWPLKPDGYNIIAMTSMLHAMRTIDHNRTMHGHPKGRRIVMLNHLSNHPNSAKNRKAKDFLDKQALHGLFPRITDVDGIPGYEAFETIVTDSLGVSEMEHEEHPANRNLKRWVKVIMSQANL